MDEAQQKRLYKAQHTSLSQIRDGMVPIWKDIRDFISPRTARFYGETLNAGKRQDEKIINGSPRDAVRTLAAGLQSGITSPMRQWFRLGLPDKELEKFGAVKVWLYEVERIMRDAFSRSNIYDRLQSTYGILGSYGTGGFFVDEDDDDYMRAYSYPIGSFSIATSPAGRVNTLYRDVTLTAYQMMQKFGQSEKDRAVLPGAVRTAYDNGNYETTFDLIHIIEPNRNFRIGSMIPKFKKYSSVWFDPAHDGGSIYRFSGYDDQPFMCPRWDVVGDDIWGLGCGEIAIGDTKQMQLMERRKLQGIDKNTNPPKIADASLRTQRVSSMPGDTTYVNGLVTGRPGVQPMYQVNPYISELREEIMNVNQRIDMAFYKNLFLMVSEIADQPNITATQINTMREEKLLMLGPVLERLNDELLEPLIARTFNILMRKGALPPPPEEIQGMPIRIEYISVLAQAQKAMGIGNIERFIGFVGQLGQLQASAGLPVDAFDKINIDAVIDEYGEGVAVPATIVNAEDQVMGVRQGRAQKQAQMERMAMMQQGAETAKSLAGTNMQGDNALTRAMEMASGS